ncbi:MAG TPA: hypothetical protein VFG66_00445 [Gemmatimonadales bacterium]|nr:hypothetical protein [Gemmatimonadales bacterium]
MSAARTATPLGLLLVLAGCYTYRPLPATLPAAGLRVQATLTDAGSDSLASRIGPGVGVVAGDVVRADSAELTLAVREVENQRGERSDWEGETVVIPRRFVRELQQRRLSLGGTGLLGGAVAAGLVAATQVFGGGGVFEGGGGGTGGGGPR